MSEITDHKTLTRALAIRIAFGEQPFLTRGTAFIRTSNSITVGYTHPGIRRGADIPDSDMEDLGRLYGGTQEHPSISVQERSWELDDPRNIPPTEDQQLQRSLTVEEIQALVADHEPPISVWGTI